MSAFFYAEQLFYGIIFAIFLVIAFLYGSKHNANTANKKRFLEKRSNRKNVRFTVRNTDVATVLCLGNRQIAREMSSPLMLNHAKFLSQQSKIVLPLTKLRHSRPLLMNNIICHQSHTNEKELKYYSCKLSPMHVYFSVFEWLFLIVTNFRFKTFLNQIYLLS